MIFEFDPSKSKINKIKHGIDFIEVQAFWEDPDLLEIPARTTDEQRFLVVGKIAASLGLKSSTRLFNITEIKLRLWLPYLSFTDSHQIQQSVQSYSGDRFLCIFFDDGFGVKCNPQTGDADHGQIIGAVADRNGLLQTDVFHRGDC
jgi:uncharacterized DUF497 family protein